MPPSRPLTTSPYVFVDCTYEVSGLAPTGVTSGVFHGSSTPDAMGFAAPPVSVIVTVGGDDITAGIAASIRTGVAATTTGRASFATAEGVA